MSENIVSIVKNGNVKERVTKATALLGGLRNFVKEGDKVLIKPNLMRGLSWKTGGTTNPEAIEETINLVRDITNEIFVVESDSTGITAEEMFEKTSVRDVAERSGAKLLNLSKERLIEVEVSTGIVLKSLKIPKIILDGKIINMPVMKTQWLTMVSLGLKNLFGLLPDPDKIKYHLLGLDHVIVDIATVIKPCLNIVDGTIGMEGQGPIKGEPVKLDMIIAGVDPVSTDTVAAMIMGFDPIEVPHIRFAAERGLGEIDLKNVMVKGELIESVKTPFKRARLATSRETFREAVLITVKNLDKGGGVTYTDVIKNMIHGLRGSLAEDGIRNAINDLISDGKITQIAKEKYRYKAHDTLHCGNKSIVDV